MREPEPVKRWRWWHNTRWWQRRRALEIARWSADMHTRLAQCAQMGHDWDLHHPFRNHGELAHLCLWCETVRVDLDTLYSYIYWFSEVYPHEDVTRVKRAALGS